MVLNPSWIPAAVSAAMVLSVFGQSQTKGVELAAAPLPRIAVPDFRSTTVLPNLMSAFNQTLWNDLKRFGQFSMLDQTAYPKSTPQQPSDFRQPPPAPIMQRRRAQERAVPQTGGGLWMTDWSGPAVNANYIAFGYTALQNGILVLYGNLFDLSRPIPIRHQSLSRSGTWQLPLTKKVRARSLTSSRLTY